MKRYVIGCDLGTGGNKAVLFDEEGAAIARATVRYPTNYPKPGYHEQRPQLWWEAVVKSVQDLLAESGIDKKEVAALGVSGHSLGCIPLDRDGHLVLDTVPIWSDTRASSEAEAYFARVDQQEWYLKTGNGFPGAHYPIFKLLWMKKHHPDIYRRFAKIIGTKDYINYRLTGRIATDYSYASGTGVYNLNEWRYDDALLRASGIAPELYPEIVPSTEIVGELTKEAADQLGLSRQVKIIAGGVDNSCMALGAGSIFEGSIYNALGSSSWIAVTSTKPLLDNRVRPFVFTHVLPGMFNSATSIFSAGTSLDWVRRCLGDGSLAQEEELSYESFFRQAESSPPGANHLFFVPTLAGGTYFEGGATVRGALVGLDLGHTQADLFRATLEGIAFALRVALDEIRRLTPVRPEMLLLGGGAKNPFWRQIFADIFDCTVLKSRIDQETAALGAGALAAVGVGLWQDYSRLPALHQIEAKSEPVQAAEYHRLLPIFKRAADHQRELGELLAGLRRSGAG